jgi:hypothetical protein
MTQQNIQEPAIRVKRRSRRFPGEYKRIARRGNLREAIGRRPEIMAITVRTTSAWHFLGTARMPGWIVKRRANHMRFARPSHSQEKR